MKTTNLQINKELIDKLLEDLEKDKMLEEYYEFKKVKRKDKNEGQIKGNQISNICKK